VAAALLSAAILAGSLAPAAALNIDIYTYGCHARAFTGFSAPFAYSETHDLNNGCYTLRATLKYASGNYIYSQTAMGSWTNLMVVRQFLAAHVDATNGATDNEYGRWKTHYNWA
jgi:hypothetical protein